MKAPIKPLIAIWAVSMLCSGAATAYAGWRSTWRTVDQQCWALLRAQGEIDACLAEKAG